MVKTLDIRVRRHMESYCDPTGKKHDGPSLWGMEQARALGRELASSRSTWNVIFYTSNEYRTQIAALLAQEAADPRITPQHTPVSALDPMRRSKAYRDAMVAAIPDGREDGNVEYLLDPDHYDGSPDTETPAQFGQRYLDHVLGLQRHFDEISEPGTLRIESIGHEPGLTALVMRLLNMDRYDPKVFGGAAKTGEAVDIRVDQQPSGVVTLAFQYRHIRRDPTDIYAFSA